ncbi:hypothetical protein [Streptomyces sp. NPDC051561]|uniref:hypothetical protein n=1 Tax=Streptomyces sp. NPDC051561 TaxID=3365658 RepID=UPI0037B72E49
MPEPLLPHLSLTSLRVPALGLGPTPAKLDARTAATSRSTPRPPAQSRTDRARRNPPRTRNLPRRSGY